MPSQNKMSKGDNPSDYNADEVEEYLETADDAEKRRVAQEEEQGKNRKGVLKAAGASDSDSDSDDDGDDSDDTPATATDNGVSESEDVAASTNESVNTPGTTAGPRELTDEEREQQEDSVAVQQRAQAGDEGYDPYNDPDVPSSAVADNIVMELAADGESPTLDSIKAAKNEGADQVNPDEDDEDNE